MGTARPGAILTPPLALWPVPLPGPARRGLPLRCVYEGVQLEVNPCDNWGLG